MDTRALVSEALILRGRDYGEADRILVVLTKDRGKMSIIAKSARKPKSSLKAAAQLFTYSNICVGGGKKGMGILTQGTVIESMMELRLDLDKIACASYIGEMIDIALPEKRPNDEVFLLALTAFKLLCVSEEYHLILQWFNLRLLAVLGYRPRLDGCIKCGRGVNRAEFVLSPARGGLVCKSCAIEGGIPVSGAAISFMDRLLTWDIRDVFKLKLSREHRLELERAIYAYMDYYLERGVKARLALKQYLLDD